MRFRSSALFISLILAVMVGMHQPELRGPAPVPDQFPPHSPPPHAAARFDGDPGECLRFLSVYVPAHGGTYILGLSFNYLDRDGDGHYTPGKDKLEVCVNCSDSCGFGP